MATTADHPRPDGPDSSDLVLVRVGLTRDPDSRDPDEGPPAPVEREGLWAAPAGDRLYRLENTPWFARNLARHDVVLAVEYDGSRWVMQKAAWSGRLTVRVAHPEPGVVLQHMAELGVGGESAGPGYGLAALDIPPGADLRAVKGRLRAEGWAYDEACVTDAWRREPEGH